MKYLVGFIAVLAVPFITPLVMGSTPKYVEWDLIIFILYVGAVSLTLISTLCIRWFSDVVLFVVWIIYSNFFIFLFYLAVYDDGGWLPWDIFLWQYILPIAIGTIQLIFLLIVMPIYILTNQQGRT